MPITPTSKGVNNIKVGAQYSQTFLRENDNLGVVESTYNSPCVNALPARNRCRATPAPVLAAAGRSQCQLPFPARALRSHPRRNCTTTSATPMSRSLLSTLRTRSRPATGSSTSAFAATSTTASTRRQPGRAATRRRLHHQAHRHRPAHLLRPHPGVALQREPRPLQPGLRQRGACAAAPLRPGVSTTPGSPASATSSTPACSRPRQEPRLQRRLHLEVHPQRLRLQRPRQHAHHLPHRLAQLQDPRLRAAPRGSQFHNFSAYSSSCRRWLGALLPPQVAGAGATVAQGSVYPFRIDHDEKFNETTHRLR
jgi:hypothetical protein